jgi:hypothetical protein
MWSLYISNIPVCSAESKLNNVWRSIDRKHYITFVITRFNFSRRSLFIKFVDVQNSDTIVHSCFVSLSFLCSTGYRGFRCRVRETPHLFCIMVCRSSLRHDLVRNIYLDKDKNSFQIPLNIRILSQSVLQLRQGIITQFLY